jgi:hypothetical protein
MEPAAEMVPAYDCRIARLLEYDGGTEFSL